MSEGASQLNLDSLATPEIKKYLISEKFKLPIYKRLNDLIIIIIVLVSSITLLVRFLLNFEYYLNLIIIFILIFLLFEKIMTRKGLALNEKGLVVPYTWITNKLISWKEIISIDEVTLTEKDTNKKIDAYRIDLDTKSLKYNISGMEAPNYIIYKDEYNKEDLIIFMEEVERIRKDHPSTPNTLAQRLEDQVQRAWKNRWRLLFLNIIDSGSESFFYILIIDAFMRGIFNFSIFPIFGLILLGLIILTLFFIQIIYIFNSKIGIRPHELGPLIFNDEEMLTNIRFIIICQPYTVLLKNCEVIYDNNEMKQVDRLKQIQPEVIPPGELKHGIAQIYGNHTKAIGARFQFSYKELKATENNNYEIEIYWS